MIKIIHFLIKLLNFIQYRDKYINEDDAIAKLQDHYSFKQTEYLINTDSGFHPISSVFKTQPYRHWKVKTKDGLEIECADHHNFFNEAGERVFANNLYIGDKVMTVNGISEIASVLPLDHTDEMFDFTVMSPEHRYYANGFLNHNTVTTGLFITWYVIFNTDRNVLVVANKLKTSREIIDKIKSIIKCLPFYIKPGMEQNNELVMRFDNGCRLFGEACTKSAALGFTVHLAFMDEFAHIPANIVDPYYRSIYPTLASSEISKMIVTSTANGKNKFWEIYQGGVDKRNEFATMRIDWWQVPGRDEKWKTREIANLGSEDLFNQEYGNQFMTGDKLLLSGETMRFFYKVQKKFKWRELPQFEKFDDIEYKHLKWSPNFNVYDIKPNDKFVLSIDISKGIGTDYGVINIFKVELMSRAKMRKLPNERVKDESSLVRLRQIGIYRHNKVEIDDFVRIASTITFDVFGADNVRIALEMNYNGDLFVEKFERHDDYYEYIFIHTVHESSRGAEIGIRLHKYNKLYYAREMRKLMYERRIVVEEENNVNELSNFGLNVKGSYSSQSGHDDAAMTNLHLVPVMESDSFFTIIGEWVENIPRSAQKMINDKMSGAEMALTGREVEGETKEIVYDFYSSNDNPFGLN